MIRLYNKINADCFDNKASGHLYVIKTLATSDQGGGLISVTAKGKSLSIGISRQEQ